MILRKTPRANALLAVARNCITNKHIHSVISSSRTLLVDIVDIVETANALQNPTNNLSNTENDLLAIMFNIYDNHILRRVS